MNTKAGFAPAIAGAGIPRTLPGSDLPPYIGGGRTRPEIVSGKPTFWAFAKKRFGTIDGEEFRRFGHEFFMRCATEYGAFRLECYRDWKEGLENEESLKHKRLAAGQLYPQPFDGIFKRSSSMAFMMYPEQPKEEYRNSHARLSWDKGRANTLWFYAQAGGPTNDRNGPLCDILQKQLFSERLGLNWKVRLGVWAYSDEWWGR